MVFIDVVWDILFLLLVSLYSCMKRHVGFPLLFLDARLQAGARMVRNGGDSILHDEHMREGSTMTVWYSRESPRDQRKTTACFV